MQIVILLLQIVVLQLPDVGVFLGFALVGLVGGSLLLQRLKLLLALAAAGLGGLGALVGSGHLGLECLDPAVIAALLAAQLVQTGLHLLQLAVVLQLMLLGLVG